MNKEQLRSFISEYISDGGVNKINEIKEVLHDLSPNKHNPVDLVRWVPIEKVHANNYNPNSVAKVEMGLLFTSIKHDGYTQPVVTFYDKDKDRYVIVDGFHRYTTMRCSKYLRELNNNLIPVVVIDKSMNDRRASTVRHNRARGSHSIEGMADLVYQMLKDGWSDTRICNELGMEADELVRLKYVTGFAKLYENVEYNKSWVAGNIKLEEENKQEETKQ